MLNVTKRPKARLILSVALVSLIAVCVATVMYEVATAQNNDATSVRNVLQQNTAAFARNDLATLDRIWANDESVTVFENGHANYGWRDYRDNHLAPEMAEMKNTKYALTDIVPHVAGNTAWATFKYTIAADIGTRRVEGSGLGTAVLEKRAGRWVIVHWHTSAPRRAPQPAVSPTPNKP